MTWFFWVLASLPFLPALNIAAGFDLASIRAIVPFLGLSVIALGLRNKQLHIPISAPFLAWSVFVLLATLSLFWAPEPAFSLRKALFFWSLLPLGVVLVNLPSSVRSRVLSAIILGASVSACIALFFFAAQFVVGHERITGTLLGPVADLFWGAGVADAVRVFPSWYIDIGASTPLLRATFPFPDPHTAALFWGMGLALGVVNIKNKSVKKVALVVLLGALLATFSRGAYIALGVLLFAYSAGFLWRRPSFQRLRLTLFLVSAVVFASVMVSLFFPPISERFLSTWEVGEGSNAARLALWRDAQSVFLTSPVLGVGLGNFASTRSPGAAYRDPTNAHSTYFEIAAELGVVGLFFFFFKLATAASYAFRTRQPAIVMALLFFVVHAVFETDLYYPANHVVFLTLITLAGIPAEFPRKKHKLQTAINFQASISKTFRNSK